MNSTTSSTTSETPGSKISVDKVLRNMNVNYILTSLHRVLSKSRGIVQLSLLLRNQCNFVIRYYLCDSRDIFQNGEAWIAQLIASKSSTFIDVGANVGNWAVLFLESMPKNGKGLLFEPSDNAINKLNQRFASLESLEVIKAAVSDSQGEMFFFEEPDAGETSSLIGEFSNKNAIKKIVNVTTLDAEVEKHQWEYVDFLKIDTEGYDLHVLRGASGLLSQQKIGAIQFEYNAPWANVGSSLRLAYKLLESFDYKVFLLKGNSLHELNYYRHGEYFAYSNFVAISPKKISELKPFIKGMI